MKKNEKLIENKAEQNFFFTLFEEAELDSRFHAEQLKLEISEQIFNFMEKKEMNQTKLAEKLGVDRSYISKILKGNINLTIETMAKIGKELEGKWLIKLEDNRKTDISPYREWITARNFDMPTEQSESATFTG